MDIDELKRLKNIETQGGYGAKVSGDTGELSLASTLRSLPDCYHIMNNILLKTKKGTTQIDHVIVSPFGIFIVETKNYKGMLFGDCFGRVWTQVLNGRGHYTVYNPVLQNEGHIRNLSKQIKVPVDYMQGVIVFTNPSVNLQNVDCPFCFTLEDFVQYIQSFNRQLFTDSQVISLIKRIDKVNISSYMNDMEHIEYVKSIREKQQRQRGRGY